MRPVGGLILAVRSDANNHHLQAFLRHHSPLCEKAVVLLNRRPNQSPDTVTGLTDEFGGKVVVIDHPTQEFHNGETCKALSRAVSMFPQDVVLHLDKDEFVSRPEFIGGIVDRIQQGRSDYAEGRMVCRFAPGGGLFNEELPSIDEYRMAAPVQSHVLGAYGFPDVKCYITRSPHIRIHKGDLGWHRDRQGMVLEHYHWTKNCRNESNAKLSQHSQGIRNQIRWRDRNVCAQSSDFLGKLRDHFRPASMHVPGWMDYQDVYRMIVESAPPGSVLVELGVWLGRSLCYLGEYANLLGKELYIYGYDHFITNRGVVNNREYNIHNVKNTLAQYVPVNTPRVVRMKSDEAAKMHKDASVFFVWLDAGHDEESVIKDIIAWRPKIMPGGILAGHDLKTQYPGVAAALKRLDIHHERISKSSWISLM